MSDLKEEMQKAFGYILGEKLSGHYNSTAEVVAAFNKAWENKHKTKGKQNDDVLE